MQVSMRLTDHVTLNIKNDLSTAAVLLDIEKPLILLGTRSFYTNNQNYIF
jgi:hypothetical protein